MFGRRYDGVKVKNLSAIEKAGPFFMPDRVGASQLITQTVPCEAIDNFIRQQRALGKDYTYTHIVIASIVRLFYLRPKMNRFIIHEEIYEHKDISVGMVVKKQLSDDGEELTLKFHFDGTETLDEVKKILDETIEKNLKANDENYKTTKAATFLGKLPAWMFRTAIWFLKVFDRHDCFTKLISESSCFHCSTFVTNLKSIKLDAIYHHLYNFGTCSTFIAMGKTKIAPRIRDNTEVIAEKVFDLGVTLDERIADGVYFSKTLRLWSDIFMHPECLLEKQISKTTLKKPRKKKRVKKAKEKKVKKEKIKSKEKNKKQREK